MSEPTVTRAHKVFVSEDGPLVLVEMVADVQPPVRMWMQFTPSEAREVALDLRTAASSVVERTTERAARIAPLSDSGRQLQGGEQ